MLCLSDDSFSSNDVAQVIFAMHQLMTLPHYFSFSIFPPLSYILNVN